MSNPTRMPATLLDLPTEILAQIVSHLATASALRNFGITCHILHELVEADGWRNLVALRFPSFQTPPQWKEAAHYLTTLSRNWDRKAFLGRNFDPFNTSVLLLPEGRTEEIRGKWKRPPGQTMGYQPVIDSYEHWTGDNWTARKEIVAWGAGARLMLKEINHDIAPDSDGASQDDRKGKNLSRNTRVRWLSYLDTERHLEGRDDITTLNLLPSQQTMEASSLSRFAIVGRASGELTMLALHWNGSMGFERRFNTSSIPVRSVDINSDQSLVAASLGDTRAVLYRVHGDKKWTEPISQVKCVGLSEPKCQTWSARFLSDQHLAIGRGPSTQIVQVYDVGATGFSREPIRSFGVGRESVKPIQTSAYPLCGIPESSIAPKLTGNVFLSGGYDGFVRIHDFRSPSDCEALISDPTDFSPIFSLLMLGRERIIAGSAINKVLKVFDLRMPGGRMYGSVDIPQPAETVGGTQSIYSCGGWNVFVSPFDIGGKSSRRGGGGPIYSLSRPSSSSSSLYVGSEGSVMQFNMTSMLDKHPDPVFAKTLIRRQNGDVDVQRSWDPYPGDRVLKLSMYEQTKEGGMPLRVQGPVQYYQGRAKVVEDGYDDRWRRVDDARQSR